MPENQPEQGEQNPRGLSPVYTTAELEKELRQGEIISNLHQYEFDPQANEGLEAIHEYAIVAGQDCDLLQDYNRQQRGEASQLISVLIYKVYTTDQIDHIADRGRNIRDRIWQNRDDRYHFLESVPVNLDLCGAGMPGFLIDFKKYFSMSPKELYRQINLENGAKRRCRLEMPYREHFQSRAAFYLQRVMLPLPHREL